MSFSTAEDLESVCRYSMIFISNKSQQKEPCFCCLFVALVGIGSVSKDIPNFPALALRSLNRWLRPPELVTRHQGAPYGSADGSTPLTPLTSFRFKPCTGSLLHEHSSCIRALDDVQRH